MTDLDTINRLQRELAEAKLEILGLRGGIEYFRQKAEERTTPGSSPSSQAESS